MIAHVNVVLINLPGKLNYAQKAFKGMSYGVVEHCVQNQDIFLSSTIGRVYGLVCIQRRVLVFILQLMFWHLIQQSS